MNAGGEREWRQFRLLTTDGVRTLLNAAMLARDGDPIQFALWATVLVSTPPSLYAFSRMIRYAALQGMPAAAVHQIALADRMFFLVYSMIAAALLAAMMWDALYPDRDDQEILGCLPVRPRTTAAARLASALGVSAAFAVAINLPSAVFFAFASVAHPALGFLPFVLAAHLIATVGVSLIVFAALLLCRALVSLTLGSTNADRLATVLQLATVMALVEVFFYLPSLLPVLVEHLVTGGGYALWLPSTWFGAIYGGLAGPRLPVYLREGVTGVAVMAMVLAALIPAYLLPARIMARRALESQSRPRPQGALSVWSQRAAAGLAGTHVAGAIARFSLITLGRSRRHVLIIVTHAGVGIALALIQVIAAGVRGGIATDTPSRTLLAMPLIVMCFSVAGMRTAFAVPRDLEANWVYRLYLPQTSAAAAGTRAALLVAGVAPTVVIAVIGAQVAGWPGPSVLLLAGLNLLQGLLLVEFILYGWAMVPFACARPLGQEGLQTRWLAAIVPFVAFTSGGAALQLAALVSRSFALGLTLALTLSIVALTLLRQRRARRDSIPFDASNGALEVLNLSEALH